MWFQCATLGVAKSQFKIQLDWKKLKIFWKLKSHKVKKSQKKHIWNTWSGFFSRWFYSASRRVTLNTGLKHDIYHTFLGVQFTPKDFNLVLWGLAGRTNLKTDTSNSVRNSLNQCLVYSRQWPWSLTMSGL